MSWPPRLAIGPFSTSARLGEVGCQRATVLSNTRSSSSHSSISRPRRRASLVVRCSLDPCSRPFALKLPIDRLPGSLWSSALFDRNAPKPAFPLERSGTSSIKVTHQDSLRGPPSGRIRPSNAGDRPEPTSKKVPHSKARSRSVSFSLGQRRINNPCFQAVPEPLCTINCVRGWLHAPSQSLPIRFRSSRPFFGKFEGSESEVGRTAEFRGPRRGKQSQYESVLWIQEVKLGRLFRLFLVTERWLLAPPSSLEVRSMLVRCSARVSRPRRRSS